MPYSRQDASPFVRWFLGAHTNAAFNELDRHVLAGHELDIAFIGESSDALYTYMSRCELLIDSALAAHSLRVAIGVKLGSRVALYLPNDVAAVAWIAAAKRLGAPYTAVAAGTAGASLADRMADTGAAVLVTGGTGYAEAVLQALAILCCDGLPVVVTEGTVASGWLDAGKLRKASKEQFGTLLDGLSDSQLVRALWAAASPRPVEASHPLFILYTSGSTGKPKGVLHTTGGYMVYAATTSKYDA